MRRTLVRGITKGNAVCRKNALMVTALGAVLVASAPALAEENWSPHLAGLGEGMASGALPPEGVYFVNTTLLESFKLYDKNGDGGDIKGNVFVDVPLLLWNPGVSVLGASYALGVAQPMTKVNTHGGPMDENEWGLYSTVLIPGILSWSLPNDFHVSAGLSVYVPDGTAQESIGSYRGGDYKGIPNSINYWVFEPSLGISWLHDGWNISASFNYDINLKNHDSGYSSGNMLVGDYTIAKTIGKWTVGVGGYSAVQLEDDESDEAAIQAGIDAADGNRMTKYAAGPLVGYDFGPVALTTYYNHAFGTKNTVDGDSFWTRLVVPF